MFVNTGNNAAPLPTPNHYWRHFHHHQLHSKHHYYYQLHHFHSNHNNTRINHFHHLHQHQFHHRHLNQKHIFTQNGTTTSSTNNKGVGGRGWQNKPEEKNMFSLASPECCITQESAWACAWLANSWLYRCQQTHGQ